MKLRVLKELLKPLAPPPLVSEEPSPLELNSYKIAKRSLYVSIASMAIAIIFGVFALYYAHISPTACQIKILNNHQRRLFDMEAADMNNKSIGILQTKLKRYNDLIYAFTELEQYTYPYRFAKEKRKKYEISSIEVKLKTVNAIIFLLKDMPDIYELVPVNHLDIDYTDCLSHFLMARLSYSDSLAIGVKTTTKDSFDALIFEDNISYSKCDSRNKTKPKIME